LPDIPRKIHLLLNRYVPCSAYKAALSGRCEPGSETVIANLRGLCPVSKLRFTESSSCTGLSITAGATRYIALLLSYIQYFSFVTVAVIFFIKE
jgi:hypothetical protein